MNVAQIWKFEALLKLPICNILQKINKDMHKKNKNTFDQFFHLAYMYLTIFKLTLITWYVQKLGILPWFWN
jgi:hypothetical protein